MKFLVPFLGAVMFISSAAAQILPSSSIIGTVIPSDGLGDGGVASQFNWVDNTVHVFIYTGDNPEPYGAARIYIPATVNPQAHPRPLCVLSGAQTGAEYAPPGFRNPYWPMVTFQTGEYTLNDGVNLTTTNVVWHAADFLQARAVYSIIVKCATRPPV